MAGGGAKPSVTKPSGGSEGGKASTASDVAAPVKQGSEIAPAVKQATAPDKATVTPGQAQTEQPDPYKLRDLTAQEDMAYWAMWMFIAAVATFIITSIGTFLIWRQVKLTREAVDDTSAATKAMERQNEISEDTAYRQLRAYLSPVDAVMEYVKHETDPFVYMSVMANIENSGLTPALITHKYFTVRLQDGGGHGAGYGPLTDIVSPRAVHPTTSDGGTRYGDRKVVRFRVGFLFTYIDYLGNVWTEAMWWRTPVDGIAPSLAKKTVKLILESHTRGPDKEIGWGEREWAEILAYAEQVKARSEQTPNEWVSTERP